MSKILPFIEPFHSTPSMDLLPNWTQKTHFNSPFQFGSKLSSIGLLQKAKKKKRKERKQELFGKNSKVNQGQGSKNITDIQELNLNQTQQGPAPPRPAPNGSIKKPNERTVKKWEHKREKDTWVLLCLTMEEEKTRIRHKAEGLRNGYQIAESDGGGNLGFRQGDGPAEEFNGEILEMCAGDDILSSGSRHQWVLIASPNSDCFGFGLKNPREDPFKYRRGEERERTHFKTLEIKRHEPTSFLLSFSLFFSFSFLSLSKNKAKRKPL